MLVFEHPALRHLGLSAASLRQRADAEAAVVIDRAQAIAGERIVREEAALRALNAIQWAELRSAPDPWLVVRNLHPMPALCASDLTVALTLHFAEHAPEGKPPRFERASPIDPDAWNEEVAQTRACWGGLSTATQQSLPIMRPWSHRWATFLDAHPHAQLGIAHLMDSLDSKNLERFAQTSAYNQGTETRNEILAEAREALHKAMGMAFPIEAPALHIDPSLAPPDRPGRSLLMWLLDWLTWETRLKVPIELGEYLAVGLAAFEPPDSFDTKTAYATLYYLVGPLCGVPIDSLDLPPALSELSHKPALDLLEIMLSRARLALRRLRTGKALDPRREPDILLLGVPILTAIQEVERALKQEC